MKEGEAQITAKSENEERTIKDLIRELVEIRRAISKLEKKEEKTENISGLVNHIQASQIVLEYKVQEIFDFSENLNKKIEEFKKAEKEKNTKNRELFWKCAKGLACAASAYVFSIWCIPSIKTAFTWPPSRNFAFPVSIVSVFICKI